METSLRIKGTCNIVADALSRLPLTSYYSTMEYYAVGQPNYKCYCLSYAHLALAQQANPAIKKELTKSDSMYQVKVFHRGRTSRLLVCYEDKIVVPTELQKHVIYWYHTTFCYPGIKRNEESIGQHLC
jgi:hypothetical protein